MLFLSSQAWICFAAVTNITADYYDVTVDDVNWLSLIYLVVTVPIGFVASWAIDTLGLRAAVSIDLDSRRLISVIKVYPARYYRVSA